MLEEGCFQFLNSYLSITNQNNYNNEIKIKKKKFKHRQLGLRHPIIYLIKHSFTNIP